MYLHKQKKKNGDIYLSIKEKYHVPKVGSRERTIESIGCLSKLKEQYDDPVKYFTQYAKELTERKKAEKTKDIKINMAATIDINTCDTRNVGYGILKYIYRELEIDKFWNWKTKNSKMKIGKLLLAHSGLCNAKERKSPPQVSLSRSLPLCMYVEMTSILRFLLQQMIFKIPFQLDGYLDTN